MAVALELDVPTDTIRAGLATYAGVDRRFQLRGQAAGVSVDGDIGPETRKAFAAKLDETPGGLGRIDDFHKRQRSRPAAAARHHAT